MPLRVMMASLKGQEPMSTTPPSPRSNAKIYDRPERRFPPALLYAVGIAILAILGFFAYRMFFASPTPVPPTAGQTGQVGSLFVSVPRVAGAVIVPAVLAYGRNAAIHVTN